MSADVVERLSDRQKLLLRMAFIEDGLIAGEVCAREPYDSPEEHQQKAAADHDVRHLISLGLMRHQPALDAMEYHHPAHHKLTGEGKRMTVSLFPFVEEERRQERKASRPGLFSWLWGG